MATNECVAVFLKYPQKGKVKTRLAKTIGFSDAALLYSAMIEDTLCATKAQARPVILFYSPPSSLNKLKKWLGEGYYYCAQKGRGLDTRMKNAFAGLFENGQERVVLIGTDIPQISGEIIENAFKAIDTRGVVTGPSYDGGYYLIGFSKDAFNSAIFKEIEKYISAYGQEPRLRDIDELADLEDFANDPVNCAKKTTAAWAKIRGKNENNRRLRRDSSN